jgi:hypothetical protein
MYTHPHYNVYIFDNPRLEFVWDGWHSTSAELSRMGWKFEVIESIADFGKYIVLKSPNGDCIGQTEILRNDGLRQSLFIYGGRVRTHVKMGRDIIHQSREGFRNMSVEFDETITKATSQRLSQIFTPSEPKLILPADTVSDLLERIQELQEPDRQERIKKKFYESSELKSISAKIVNFK